MRVTKVLSVICGAAALTIVAACNTTEPQDVNRVQNSANAEPIGFGKAKASFALAGVVSSIRRGTPIFAFPATTETSGTMCNFRSKGDDTVTWAGGDNRLGSWSSEVGGIFYEELSLLGYKVAGNPNAIFHQAKAANSAEFRVGGKLTSMKGNFCQEHDIWVGLPRDTFSGEMSVEIEWAVLDSRTDKVITTIKTTGYYRQEKPIREGINTTFVNAIADAIVALGNDNRFRKLAVSEESTKPIRVASKQTGLVVENGEAADIRIPGVLTRSTVTIRVGGGHGSGFFIGSEGLIMTNAHVVGDADTAQVITNSGLEVGAKVIARHEIRDVAVLSTPIRNPNPPMLQVRLPGVTETVYAVGSPVDPTLQATVTRGIVSNIRRDKRTGQRIIQADAAISGGNSGGPLYDGQGRIVGISVASVIGGEALNLFIPIGEGLEKLGIQVN